MIFMLIFIKNNNQQSESEHRAVISTQSKVKDYYSFIPEFTMSFKHLFEFVSFQVLTLNFLHKSLNYRMMLLH